MDEVLEMDIDICLEYAIDNEREDWIEQCEENGWEQDDFSQLHIYAIAQRAWIKRRRRNVCEPS